jgi:signal transduction histidine kinase/DNA-binding response OmpR family regulator
MAQTVLLIDGDASRADALKIFLARKHVEVKTAVTADKAGRLMAGADYRIILANPYGVGTRFPLKLKKFKEANLLPPLIVFTPAAMLDRAMADFGTLAVSYLETPINSKALELAIQQAEKWIRVEKKLSNYSQRLSDLHNAQILYHQLFNEVPCYITVQNRDLRLTDSNLKFKKDFGDAVGGFCYETYKHRDSPCPQCPVAKTFADGMSHGTEEVVTSKSGRQYNVITQTAPVRDETGEITQVMEISTNITKVRQLQDHLSSLGLMIGSISHGIKGTLTALDGSIYQLETGLQKGDRQRVEKSFSRLKKISEGIKRMVLDILDYAKSRELKYRSVDMGDLLETVVSTVARLARENNVRLETDIEETLDNIELDANWMQTALVNLLENAVEACGVDSSKKNHHVRLTARGTDDDHICISIADNGTGMNKRARESLFTLFASSKGAKGTGLGLFIANHVVAQHGGSITVRSRLKKGTCFEIRLPRKRVENPRISFYPETVKHLTY